VIPLNQRLISDSGLILNTQSADSRPFLPNNRRTSAAAFLFIAKRKVIIRKFIADRGDLTRVCDSSRAPREFREMSVMPREIGPESGSQKPRNFSPWGDRRSGRGGTVHLTPTIEIAPRDHDLVDLSRGLGGKGIRRGRKLARMVLG